MGRVTVAGGNPGMKVPVTGILAGTMAVGSTVKLMESGTAVEYLVVNQGIPSNSSLYDSTCNGTWLLRKEIKVNRVFGSTNDYEGSPINTWLNGDFFTSLGTKDAVKQVRIPYVKDYAVKSGALGLLTKVFLLSITEAGWTIGQHSIFVDGDSVAYFKGAADTDSKRIAYLNGAATAYFCRTADTEGSYSADSVLSTGGFTTLRTSEAHGIRPALVLHKTAIFDKNTMVLKGVA